MLKNKYGYVTIEKDSILYVLNDYKIKSNEFKINNDNVNTYLSNKYFLKCAFHPSEFTYSGEKYIHLIKLKKDINLLFLIEKEMQYKKYMLPLYINKDFEYNTYTKLYNFIKEEELNGYFSTAHCCPMRYLNLEIALLNDDTIYSYTTHKLKIDWRRGYKKDNVYINKIWGSNYEVCCIKRPIKLFLNNEYKKLIKQYCKFDKKNNYNKEFVFQLILENAIINYFD